MEIAENGVIIKGASEDKGNELVAEVLTELIHIPGAVNLLIQLVPDDFQTDDGTSKDNLVYQFLWEYMTFDKTKVREMVKEVCGD